MMMDAGKIYFDREQKPFFIKPTIAMQKPKTCRCGVIFTPQSANHKHCTAKCRGKKVLEVQTDPLEVNSKGNRAELDAKEMGPARRQIVNKSKPNASTDQGSIRTAKI